MEKSVKNGGNNLVTDTMNPDLQRKLDKISKKLEAAFVRAGEMMIQRGKQLASERLTNPGSYVDCFWYEVRRVGNDLVLEFGNYHEAATFLEFGTKGGYPIPRVPSGVWFKKHGKWIRKAQIIHPGVEATKIVEDAFNEFKGILSEEIRMLW